MSNEEFLTLQEDGTVRWDPINEMPIFVPTFFPSDEAVARAMEAEDAHQHASRKERVRAMLEAAMGSD